MEEKQKTVLLFVYGTLMSGFGNNRLLEGQNLIGEGETKEKYTMYASGIPFVNENKETSKIKGELYEVNIGRMPALDGLEGHPDWYQRKLIPVNVNNKEYKAWLYFNNENGGNLLEDGDYRRYRNEGILQSKKVMI